MGILIYSRMLQNDNLGQKRVPVLLLFCVIFVFGRYTLFESKRGRNISCGLLNHPSQSSTKNSETLVV
jgi:hypothetical protein